MRNGTCGCRAGCYRWERAAMMLGITQRSVLNLIERRRLVAYRIEGVWRVDLESVRRYLAER
ncbi:MAG: helix-turn-helix domain-containing protein, partial [Chloroflexota bacterium]